jgi:integrase
MWNSLMQTYSSQYPDNNPPRLFTSHQLRHTYISLLYDAGVDVKTAQKWAGHASVSLTLDVYTHLSAKKEKDAESVLRNYVLTDDTSDDKVNVNC